MKKKYLISVLLAAVLVAAFSVCAFAAPPSEGYYVYDEYGLLTDSEYQTLNSKAAAIAETRQCEVYIVTVDDYRSYGNYSECYYFAVDLYKVNEMGYGSSKDGLILVLSMADRDYGLAAYGSLGNRAFSEKAQDAIESAFLDDFRRNDWYGGFSDYLSEADYYLELNGNPQGFGTVLAETFAEYGLPLAGISIIIGLIVVAVLSAPMKSVKRAVRASKYRDPGNISLKLRRDDYSHTTTTRVRIQQPQNHGGGGGGPHHSGGGFSGRSGKF